MMDRPRDFRSSFPAGVEGRGAHSDDERLHHKVRRYSQPTSRFDVTGSYADAGEI